MEDKSKWWWSLSHTHTHTHTHPRRWGAWEQGYNALFLYNLGGGGCVCGTLSSSSSTLQDRPVSPIDNIGNLVIHKCASQKTKRPHNLENVALQGKMKTYNWTKAGLGWPSRWEMSINNEPQILPRAADGPVKVVTIWPHRHKRKLCPQTNIPSLSGHRPKRADWEDDPKNTDNKNNNKLDKLYYLKLRNFCASKDTINKVKMHPTEQEKIFSNHIHVH
jgi:hypothetical protein